MTKIKSLSNEQESAIADALAKLKRLETCQDILTTQSYHAGKRDILRNLTRALHSSFVDVLRADGWIPKEAKI